MPTESASENGGPQLFCGFLECLYEWRPDFDVRLRDPNGNIVAEGICMLGSLYGFECDNVGRQETVHIPTPLAGTYTLEVYKGTGDSSLVMEVPGGSVDGVTLRVSGQPVVNEGERAVFFLDAEEAGTHKPHLRGQGVLKLDSSNVVRGSSLRLDDIRRAARAAKN